MIRAGKDNSYQWIDNWARIPAMPAERRNGRTHSVVVSREGRVFVFHQAVPAVLEFTAEGRLRASWGEFAGAHGMTLAGGEGGEEHLWLTDEFSSLVVKATLDGRIVRSLKAPSHPAYGAGGKKYVPTWAAENPDTGDVWVADGYGASLVHRFTPGGECVQTLDGTEGAGRFNEPHGILVRRGRNGIEILITDRANHRIVVYDGEGRFLRASGSAHSPCSFGALGSRLVVPELFTGLKILDADSLEVVDEIGANPLVRPRADGGWWPPQAPEGWPDFPPERLQPGVFNSPHGACFTPAGDILVVEWIIGGRITKLEAERGRGGEACELADRRCAPCKGGVPPIKGPSLHGLQAQLAHGWSVVEEHHLTKEFRFKNFREALAFTNQVGELAEQQGHHPDIYLSWGRVEIEVWTHKVDGLTESDFIFAAKVDRLSAG